MRPEVHQAALKAAAKVAFSIVFLQGCAGAVSQEGAKDEGEGYAKSESDVVLAKKQPESRPRRSLGKKACEDAGTTTPPEPTSCEATLAAAFPTPSEYKWEPEPQSKEVVDCCRAALADGSEAGQYRWDCCVAYDAADPNKETASSSAKNFACTPWGPPVPPSIKRSRKANPEIAAWIAQAVA